MDKLSNKIKFVEIRYVESPNGHKTKTSYALKWAGTKFLILGPQPNLINVIKSDPKTSWAYLNYS